MLEAQLTGTWIGVQQLEKRSIDRMQWSQLQNICGGYGWEPALMDEGQSLGVHGAWQTKALQFDCFAFGLAKDVVEGNERFATLDQC